MAHSTSLLTACRCFIFAALLCTALTAGESYTVVLMSDLHYDPYYGTGKAYVCSDQSSLRNKPYGQAGCDTPPSLLNSALEDATNLVPSALFMGGDWLRHQMDELPSSDVNLTLSAVAIEVHRATNSSSSSPNVNWALGNDDLVPEYTFNVSALLQLRSFGNVMLHNNLITAAEKATFEDCGHFFRDLKNMNIRVISLNTILWSPKIIPAIDASEMDPCGQLEFLENSLVDAVSASRRVIILGHIPPGLDVRGVMTSGFSQDQMFWASRFQASFINIVRRYAANITFMLFGHTHMLSFIADTSTFPTIPIFIVPSISPVFSNNPSYLIATIDSITGNVQRLRHRVFSLADESWGNYAELAASFGGIDLSNVTELARVASTFQHDGVIATSNFAKSDFLTEYSSSGNLQTIFLSGGKCDGKCSSLLFCSMKHLAFADIQQCSTLRDSSTIRVTSPATILFTVLSVLVFFVSLGMMVHRRGEMSTFPPVSREAAVLSATYIMKTTSPVRSRK
jgi:hypothetical protein